MRIVRVETALSALESNLLVEMAAADGIAVRVIDNDLPPDIIGIGNQRTAVLVDESSRTALDELIAALLEARSL